MVSVYKHSITGFESRTHTVPHNLKDHNARRLYAQLVPKKRNGENPL